MKPNLLPLAVVNAETELRTALPAFLRLPPDVDQHLEICTLYRRIAVGSLLLTADPRLFFDGLQKSGRCLVHALRTADPERFVTSRMAPFFDALACRDDEAARAIAETAPEAPRPGVEYEEDFLAVRIPMDLLLGRPAADVASRVGRFEALAEENPDPWQPLCSAVAAADQSAFDAALAEAIAARREAVAADLEDESMDPDAAPLAPVSVEILGWLELARRCGLVTAEATPLAPAVARAFHLLPPPSDDGWRHLGATPT